MTKVARILSLLLLAVGASTAWSHGEGQHVLGTITAMRDGHLEVKTPKGETVSVELNDQTRYRAKGDPGRSEPKVGDRVVIDVAKTGRSLVATEVQFAGQKKPGAKK